MANPNLNFTHSKCRLRQINKVQFGIFSPDILVSYMIYNNIINKMIVYYVYDRIKHRVIMILFIFIL